MPIKLFDARGNNKADASLVETLETLAQEIYLSVSVAYGEDDRKDLILNAMLIAAGAFLGQSGDENVKTPEQLKTLILPYFFVGMAHTTKDKVRQKELHLLANQAMKNLSTSMPISESDESMMNIVEKSMLLTSPDSGVKH